VEERGLDSLSKAYEYFIKLGIEIHYNRMRLESDPNLEPKIRKEFQDTIQKITEETIMFEEISKMPKRFVEGLKMLCSLELENRLDAI
jgi:hypothetical protein